MRACAVAVERSAAAQPQPRSAAVMGVTSGGGICSGDAAAGCMPSSATLQQSGTESSEVYLVA